MRYCNKCGHTLKEDALFCGNCGAKQVMTQQPIENSEEEMVNASETIDKILPEEISNINDDDNEEIASKPLNNEVAASLENNDAMVANYASSVMSSLSNAADKVATKATQLEQDIKVYNAQRQKQYAENAEHAKSQLDEGLKDIFIDENEEKISMIHSKYVENAIQGNGLIDNYMIVSNKRFYYHGKAYLSSDKGSLSKIDTECSIDLQDIINTGIVRTKVLLFKVLAILGILIIAALFIMYRNYPYELPEAILVYGGVVDLIMWAIYFIGKKAYYSIGTANNTLLISVSKFQGIHNIRYFDKQVRKAKDKLVK